MNSFALTLRAIGAQLALRLYVPIVTVAGGILALLAIGAWWLTTQSAWWWLLFIPIIIAGSVAVVVAWVTFALIRYVRPRQTKAQKQAIGRFIDRLQGIGEIASTPKFIILFQVIRSISAPSKHRYLSELAQNKELGKEFRELQRSFETPAVIE